MKRHLVAFDIGGSKVAVVAREPGKSRDVYHDKIKTPEKNHAELRAIADTYEAQIVDVSPDALMIEATGTAAKLDALEERLAVFGITELCRSGAIALERGFKTLAPPHLKEG